jgi:hypothetical protein
MDVAEIGRERHRAQCDAHGVSWARGNLPNLLPDLQVVYREWIDEYEQREATVERTVQRELMVASIEAAREAALSSKRSAFWTMVAAIVAAIGTLATAAGVAIPILQGMGQLPK